MQFGVGQKWKRWSLLFATITKHFKLPVKMIGREIKSYYSVSAILDLRW